MGEIKATIVWDRKWSDKISAENFALITQRALVAVGIMLEGYAVSIVPVVSGRLKGSITYATQMDQSRPRAPATIIDSVSVPGDKFTLHVGTNVEYAEAIEYGISKPYTIKPKSKKALFWKGAAHPVRSVVHPATNPQPFLRRALDDNHDQIPILYRDEMRRGFGQ